MKKLPEGWAFYDKMLPVFGVGTNRILSSYIRRAAQDAHFCASCAAL